MKNIILIGMPGSGKSSVGKILAQEFNMKFLDTDERIEVESGLTINQIFRTYGETFFREKEREWILKNYNMKNAVISTGGGMPIYLNNMDILDKIGITVFINTDLKVLNKRLYNDLERPLIRKAEDKHKTIENLYSIRKECYLKSAINLSVKEERIEEIVNIIKERVKKYS
ncbi:shikimate kinase [Clostridium polynesiense]|uniref:shikimate kinase n=1 Tax=Clostridium polynesiense TaxID=1325933 RepID=UPI00058FC84A|nr:shikimate kinase [Clostridium polynesiense]